MNAFSYAINTQLQMMSVKFEPAFKDKKWDDVISFYKKKVEDGFLMWELDLTALTMISSNSIGMLVALNTSLRAHAGSLRVRLARDSYVATQVLFAGIDKLMECQVV